MRVVTRNFDSFKERAEELVNSHPVVVDNTYTKWFAGGDATYDEVRHLAIQFSVFSHLFIEAQLRKVINAPNLEEYRASKEILMNELGVVFRKENGGDTNPQSGEAEHVDPDVVGTEGTVEGSRYHHAAAHFEWLARFGHALGLDFEELGKRRHATRSTAFFCDELLRIYGSE